MSNEKVHVYKRLSVVVNGITKEALAKYAAGQAISSSTSLIALGDNRTKWSLQVYPNGNGENNKSNISFFLRLQDFDSTNFVISFKLGVFGKTGKENYTKDAGQKSGKEIDEIKGKSWGFTQFISHDELLKHSRGLVNNGSLTFLCDLTLSNSKDTAGNDIEVSNLRRMASDCKRLFVDKLWADFELKTKDGQTLKAHKAILAARSSVFLAMLTTETKETKENFVNIPDFDSVVMKEVLRFIYCNEVKGLKAIAHRLVYAADMYQIDGLRKLCVDEVISSLSTENVLNSLVIADRVNETKNLFAECLNYIIAFCSIDEITATEEWKDLPQSVMTEIIREMLKRNRQENSLPAEAQSL